jgi:GGDEF domain-containing protein
MGISEIAVWSAMVGGLLTMVALSASDVAISRNIASVRALLFVVLTGASCVLMTGLPEVFFPGLPPRLLLVLKAGLGPLAGAIALAYLGIWLGGMREDVVVYRLTAWGGGALFVGAAGLTLWAILVAPDDFRQLLLVTGVVNMTAVVLGIIATARATSLGDPLARWMVMACVLLAAMVGGHYLHGLGVPGPGLGTWILTAVFTVAYFLLVSILVIERNRQNRRLTRLSRLQIGSDPATGLPTGSTLISEVEHAFWRTARMNGECSVVCLHLRNLYELGQAAGRGVEHQIQVAMAARIRRAAGFRCIVGLYHPRCFVVLISADKQASHLDSTVKRLRQLVAQPLSVVGANHARHDFMPQLGVGVVTFDPAHAKPLEVINEAERRALGGGAILPAPLTQDAIETRW